MIKGGPERGISGWADGHDLGEFRTQQACVRAGEEQSNAHGSAETHRPGCVREGPSGSSTSARGLTRSPRDGGKRGRCLISGPVCINERGCTCWRKNAGPPSIRANSTSGATKIKHKHAASAGAASPAWTVCGAIIDQTRFGCWDAPSRITASRRHWAAVVWVWFTRLRTYAWAARWR